MRKVNGYFTMRYSLEEENLLATLFVEIQDSNMENDKTPTLAQQIQQLNMNFERSDSEWRLAAMKAVCNLARRTEHFAAHAVTRELRHEPVHSCTKGNLGIVLAAAKKRGYIVNDGAHRREGAKYATVLWRSCLQRRTSTSR